MEMEPNKKKGGQNTNARKSQKKKFFKNEQQCIEI